MVPGAVSGDAVKATKKLTTLNGAGRINTLSLIYYIFLSLQIILKELQSQLKRISWEIESTPMTRKYLQRM